MLKHKYLFLEISTGKNNVAIRKVLNSREAGMKLMERELSHCDAEVIDLIYRDKRKHLQEFICTNGLVFIINRI
jgi:hypothetical protein